MPTLSWNLNAGVQNGPQIAVAQTLAVEGYDKTEVAVPFHTGTDTTTVEIQPGAADHVRFLAILADRYGEKLTYHVDGGAATPIKLDAPQVLAGAGAVGLLAADPKKLIFTNKLNEGQPSPKPVTVQILVGRKAT